MVMVVRKLIVLGLITTRRNYCLKFDFEVVLKKTFLEPFYADFYISTMAKFFIQPLLRYKVVYYI